MSVGSVNGKLNCWILRCGVSVGYCGLVFLLVVLLVLVVLILCIWCGIVNVLLLVGWGMGLDCMMIYV